MRPDRAVARGCSGTTLPGAGALQAVLAQYSPGAGPKCALKARTRGHIGIAGSPSLSRASQAGSPPPPPTAACGTPRRSEQPGAAASRLQRLAPSPRTGRLRIVGALRNGAQLPWL